MTPDKYMIAEKMLEVGDGHSLYIQLWGNDKSVKNIIFLHGGPGGGCSDSHKTIFDPAKHKVAFFDQRGSGRSLPYGSLKKNTTGELVEDINKVAEAAGFKKFAIVGGSWGSTLALAYGVKYPKRLEYMIIRAVFTARQSEINFLDEGGFRPFFPEVWEEYQNSVPAKHRDNPSRYHMKRIFGKNAEEAKSSAYAYARLEHSLLTLDDRFEMDKFEEFDPKPITVECHYLVNRCFMPEGHIMSNAHKIKCPVYIVQGRYDIVCPPATAYELSKKLSDSRLILTIASHVGWERSLWDVMRTILKT